MKFKLLALAAVMAVSGAASAATISNGSTGNGGLFFSIWDGANSYSRNLGDTIDSFESFLASTTVPFDKTFAADATLTSFLSTASLSTLKWNVVAGDNSGPVRLLETFTLPKATLTIGADKVRLATAGTALFVTDLNTKLASSDSATYAVNTIGYAGNAAMFGDKAGGKLNFSNAGTLSNNSIATGLGFMRINGTSSGLTASTYTPYAIGGNAVNVYFDTASTLHISAISAVPEPETYAMLLAGLGLMGAIARRRNKKSV